MADKKATKEESINDIFSQLDEIVEKLNSSDSTLEESFEYYKKGAKLLETCKNKIDKIEKELTILNDSQQDE